MSDSIAIGASGMRAQQQVVETLSANIANVNTPSYKRVQPQLRASGFSAAMLNEDAPDASGALLLSQLGGVSSDIPLRDMTLGALKKTERPLDIAIRGNGFFALTRPDGSTVYSRNGNFRLDGEGYLVDANGYRLQSDIQMPPEAASPQVDPDGRVHAIINNKDEVIGSIELARFAAPDYLAYESGGIYQSTDQSGEAEMVAIADGGVGPLAQGYLETSNVKIVDEFVSLVVAQRAYEASAKMVQAADEMTSIANGLLRS